MRFGILILAAVLGMHAAGADSAWYKGATHCHSLWSDGDAPPETVAAWFKDNGFHFHVMSEHHLLPQGERYYSITENGLLTPAHIEALRARFGPDWVETREEKSTLRMRLKTFAELSARFNEPGRYLIVQGEEITSIQGQPHMIGINLQEAIRGAKGGAFSTILDGYIEETARQQAATNTPMIAHVNHPNWREGVTAEDLIATRGLRFFEVYNGQRACRSAGWPEKHRPSSERLWDIVLAMRLHDDPDFRLYGFATDDCHHYYESGPEQTNPGRGWVMVRAPELSAAALVLAMDRGDFYASTGVTLRAVEADAEGYRFAIDAQPGITYTTRFIGTRRGFDRQSQPVLGEDSAPLPGASHRYSDSIGVVLLETTDLNPAYTFAGDELYVRAEVLSSADQPNPPFAGDKQRAWLQPVTPRP